jgi:F-type H+-transporting ATPase subunit gamma
MPTRVDAIPSLANGLVDALYDRIASGAMDSVDVVFSRSVPSSGIVIDRHSVLPLDFRRFTRPIGAKPPLTTLAAAVLLRSLAAEYVYAQVCQAAMHAFVAESEARMLAMASAKTSVDRKLTDLSGRERQLRQEEITAEIMELAAGAEAALQRRS